MNEKHIKKVTNGLSAELICALLMYPISTLKTNAQIGRKVPLSMGNLFRGVQYCIVNEIINGILFYSIYNYLENKPQSVRSACGSLVAISGSYPFYLRRKLSQVRKTTKCITNNYRGFINSLITVIPTVALNFTLKEHLDEKLGMFAGYGSTILSVALTYPLDTIATCVMTKTPIRIKDALKFNGFGHKILERGLTVGTKLGLLDYFNKEKTI
jgi:hypothetical protein